MYFSLLWIAVYKSLFCEKIWQLQIKEMQRVLDSVPSFFFYCYPLISPKIGLHLYISTGSQKGNPQGPGKTGFHSWLYSELSVKHRACLKILPSIVGKCFEVGSWKVPLKNKVWGEYYFLQVEIFLLFKFHLPFPQNICRGDRNRVWKREREWILL